MTDFLLGSILNTIRYKTKDSYEHMCPVVSVIIPVYNRREQLLRAIASVQKQQFTHFELIVVDDGSDEDLGGVIPCDSNSVPTTRYMRLPLRSGVAFARNRGVEVARGEWIAFLDSDDTWLPDKLTQQLAWLQRNPSIQILQSREHWIRNGVRVNPPKSHEKFGGNLFAASIERCMITPSSVIMRKRFFEGNGCFNETFPACEDYDLWLRITAKHPVGFIDKTHLVRYGGHDDQLSATVPALDRFRVRSLLGLLLHGSLCEEQKVLVRKNLVKRAAIVAQGYYKRENREMYERFSAIAEQYR